MAYDPTISVEKGVTAGGVAGLGGVLGTVLLVGISAVQSGGLDDAGANTLAGAIVTLATAGGSALAAWWRNRRKHKRAAKPFSPRLRGWAILVAAGLALSAVSGCATTVGTDGTRTYSVDPVAISTAWQAWSEIESRRAILEAQKQTAKAEDRARLEAQLLALEPEIRAAWERVLAAYE